MSEFSDIIAKRAIVQSFAKYVQHTSRRKIDLWSLHDPYAILRNTPYLIREILRWLSVDWMTNEESAFNSRACAFDCAIIGTRIEIEREIYNSSSSSSSIKDREDYSEVEEKANVSPFRHILLWFFGDGRSCGNELSSRPWNQFRRIIAIYRFTKVRRPGHWYWKKGRREV